MLGPQCLPFDFYVYSPLFCGQAKVVGPSLVTTVIKAFTNSWVTSHRFHEEVRLPCIFGCEDGQDSLNHYLTCDPLWSIVCSCAGTRVELLGDTPVQRLGLARRSYHAIRMNHAARITHAVQTGDFYDIIELLLEYAAIPFKDLT